MRFYVTGRQHGKTERMLRWMRANPDTVMLCHSAEECSRLARQSELPIGRFITFKDAHDGTPLRGRKPLRVGIDNLDILIERCLKLPPGSEILYVTATGENDGER